jgi:AcrR family transcriptional regulator
MPSIRHTDQAVLDATRACVLSVGVRRTTLTDVARRAGLSRMTLYRRYPDINALVRELMTREFSAVLESATHEAAEAPTARERLVRQVLAGVKALGENELFRRVVDVDPELLVTYLFDRLGATQQAAVALFADQLARGHADGSIRRGSVAVQSHTMLLTVQPFVLSLRPAAAIVPAHRLHDELSILLDAYLRP